MNTFAFVVTIVAIACATSVIHQYLRTKRKTAEKDANADVDETLAQLEALEERIRVLERIVTESKFDLKREIDKL